jgi:hypothetical protein
MNHKLEITVVKPPPPNVDREYIPTIGTWSLIAALYRNQVTEQPIICTGVSDLIKRAAPIIDPLFQSPGISSYSVRRGLRELVDLGAITCSPNPALGERLPD